MKNKELSPAAKRKREQRKRDKQRYATMEIKRVEIELSKNERKWLAQLGEYYGGYDQGECISTLIRQAYKTMQETASSLEPCGLCGKTWPESCGDSFKGTRDCFLTHKHRVLVIGKNIKS